MLGRVSGRSRRDQPWYGSALMSVTFIRLPNGSLMKVTLISAEPYHG
ncbi:hypothetical protein GS905_25535 [Rhodococcus hoagii]|nr:hypothetical protein [Prescottella equi]